MFKMVSTAVPVKQVETLRLPPLGNPAGASSRRNAFGAALRLLVAQVPLYVTAPGLPAAGTVTTAVPDADDAATTAGGHCGVTEGDGVVERVPLALPVVDRVALGLPVTLRVALALAVMLRVAVPVVVPVRLPLEDGVPVRLAVSDDVRLAVTLPLGVLLAVMLALLLSDCTAPGDRLLDALPVALALMLPVELTLPVPDFDVVEVADGDCVAVADGLGGM